MTQPEFDPVAHEVFVTELHLKAARVALFDELIDFALDGQCTFDEAVSQYLHDSSLLAGPAQPSD